MKTIYLDTKNGSDSKDGLTVANAVKSISVANSKVGFGDTIEILSGSRIGAVVAFNATDGVCYYDATNSTDAKRGDSYLMQCVKGVTYKMSQFSQVFEKPILSAMVTIPNYALTDVVVDSVTLKHFKLQHRCAPICNDTSVLLPYIGKEKAWLAVIVNGLKLTKCFTKSSCASTPNSYYSEDVIAPTGTSDGSAFVCDTFGTGGFYFNYEGEIDAVQAPFFQNVVADQSNIVLQNLTIESGAVKNNLNPTKSQIIGCDIKWAMMHGGLFPSNAVKNCKSDAPFCGFLSYVDTTIHGVRFNNCIADRSAYVESERGYYGFYTHGNTSTPNSGTQILRYTNCYANNYQVAFFTQHHKYSEVVNAVVVNCKAIAQGVSIVKNVLMLSKPKSTSEVLKGTGDVENCGILGTRHAVVGSVKNCTFVTQNEDTEWSDTSVCEYENCVFTDKWLGQTGMSRVYKNCYFRIGSTNTLWRKSVADVNIYTIEQLSELYPNNFVNCKSNVSLIDKKLWTIPTISIGKASKGYGDNQYWVYDGRYLMLYTQLPTYLYHNRGSATYDADLALYTTISGTKRGKYLNAGIGKSYYDNVNGETKYAETFGEGITLIADSTAHSLCIKIDLEADNVFKAGTATEIHTRYYNIDLTPIFGGTPQANKYKLLADSVPAKMGAGCDFTNVNLPDKDKLESFIL